MPGLRQLAILASDSPHLVQEIGEVQRAARTLALEVATFEIRRYRPTFETLKGGAHALYVISDPVTVSNRVRINTLALGARLPTMHSVRDPVEAGGLMSYCVIRGIAGSDSDALWAPFRRSRAAR
jgi:putative tryptophan/tyrosine transport system substrate-binding protein